MTAIISECGTYRYTLTRELNCPIRWNKPCLFIMLNPSTADATKDDPTIRRCIKFAERHKCTKLTVVNLFALRATDPKELLNHPDPIGPLNHQYLEDEVDIHQHGLIIAAWGSHPFAKDRATQVIESFGPFSCLGRTKDGSPRHPLYVKSDTPLIPLDKVEEKIEEQIRKELQEQIDRLVEKAKFIRKLSF